MPQPRCTACGASDDYGPMAPCPACASPLHHDCAEYAGCPGCAPTPCPEPAGMRPASPARRSLACVIDTGVLLAPGLLASGLALGAGLGALAAIGAGTAAALATSLVNTALFLGEGGATLGKKACGLQVLDPRGAPLGWRRALRREYLQKGVSLFPLGLGALRAIGDPDSATLHDRLSGSMVLEPAPVACLPGPGG